jgi:hypothetical protein
MKLRSTLFLTLTVSLVLVASGISSAQQRGQRGRGGFGFLGGGGTSLITIAANENVQKDLGLSADTSGKLRELRDDYFAAVQKENQNAGINFQGFQNMSREERDKLTAKITEVSRKLNDEFNPKVKALVTDDQYMRLQQIQLQSNLRNRGPGALTYSQVASELKLTDDQKKRLDDLQTEFDRKQRELFSGGGQDREAFAKLRDERTAKTMEVLTADQKTTLEKLKGPDFDVSQLGFGGRGRRGNN